MDDEEVICMKDYFLLSFSRSYTVEYCEVSNWKCRLQNVSGSIRNTTLSGLLACTSYIVSITPYSEAGPGPSLNVSLYTRVLGLLSKFHFLMFIQSFISRLLNFELIYGKISVKLLDKTNLQNSLQSLELLAQAR